MLQQQVYIINSTLMVLDAVCIILAGYGAQYLAFKLIGGYLGRELFLVSMTFVMLLNNYIMGRFGLYRDKFPRSYLGLLWTISKVVAFELIILSSLTFLIQNTKYSRNFILLFSVISFALLFMERSTARIYLCNLAKKRKYAKRLLAVGNSDRVDAVIKAMERQLSWGHIVVGRLRTKDETAQDSSSLGTIEELPKILQTKEIDEVIFAVDGDRSVELKDHIDLCRKMGITTIILPALWEKNARNFTVERYQNIPFLALHSGSLNASGLLYKRVLDLVGGLVGTIVFILLYPLIGLAIKLESSGPVLFKQVRVGQNGRTFNLFKFRSMYVDAEEKKKELMADNEMRGAMFKIKNDPRITKVGNFIRKTSLDEIPQFLNVVVGDMSLVGTRPPTLDEVKLYAFWQRRRISAKPGITGLWQVSGRNAITDFDKVVELDCQYLENWRFSRDLQILIKTIFVVFRRTGS